MKNQLLSIAFVIFIVNAHGQNLLHAMQGERGVAKQYAEFAAQEQPVFNEKNAASILGLDKNSGLVLSSIETDRLGFTHFRFYQTYNGIAIDKTMLVAHVKDGKLISVSAALVTDFNSAMKSGTATQKITTADAIGRAVAHVHALRYAWQDKNMEAALKEQTRNVTATYYPDAKKVWYNPGDQLDPATLHLAYKIDVYAEQPESRAFYFVDANSGEIIGREERIHSTNAVGNANTLYSGTRTVQSEQMAANSYRLRDHNRGNGIITLNADKTDITNTSFDWDLTLPGKNGLDAHWGVEMTYDYYKINFNRNSIDNNGYALYSYINKGGFLYSDNASWDGNAMNFGTRSNSDGAGVTGIDVTGHELTHGVTQFTCNLNYSKEPGAINESISDIMGKSVQFFAKPADKDWRLSNDMNWFIRDMSNPNAYAQPDTYGGDKWLGGGFNYLLDNGGVHTNSGVGNFMFYLLVDGGSGTNDIGNTYKVQGIGLSKADQIIYRSQTVYLVPTSQFTDWRTACINAARDLYGKGSNELKQVKNAFYAVGIGTGAVATAVATNQIVSVTPNPVHGINAVAKFDLQSAGYVVMKLYDGSAQVLHVYNIGTREKGEQSFTLPGTAELKEGNYYITIENDGVAIGRGKFLVIN